MGTYEVWFKKEFDGRAGEAAFLDLDYLWAGEVTGVSVPDVQRQISVAKDDDATLEQHRPLRTGDVIKDPMGRYWTLTPVGVWSEVRAFEEPNPSAA
jgi:hypothetical protein